MKALGQNPTPEELEVMLHDVDTDGSGTIDIDEFITMMAKRSKGNHCYNSLYGINKLQSQLWVSIWLVSSLLICLLDKVSWVIKISCIYIYMNHNDITSRGA